MATGVLPFVRGIDLAHNDFSGYTFPENVADMTGLRWLRLSETKLMHIPEELKNLKKLESLQMKRNQLNSLQGNLSSLPCLRVINCKDNQISKEGVPRDLFNLEELSVLDLSHNELDSVPSSLERGRNMLVLNLSHNQIEAIPSEVFINLTDLIHLDLSDNKLEALPPQLRRLANLQILILNNNPLIQAQLRQLPALVSLQTLHMRSTQRTLSNFPAGLESLHSLADVDLSRNELPQVPESLYKLPALKRLNLSDNHIKEIALTADTWTRLEFLNVSRNEIAVLPSSITRITSLKKIYVNSNQLYFEGIPAGIGKLHNLEVFSAAYNNLEMIPEGLCRCGKLRRLILNNNQLVTIPDAHYFLTDLELDVRENPNLIFPPRPPEAIEPSLEFYKVNFDVNEQLRKAGANVPAPQEQSPVHKDPIARKLRLRNRRRDSDDSASADSVLKGMRDIAKDKNTKKKVHAADDEGKEIRGKRWDENLVKPKLDYSEIFEEDVGQIPGLTCWEIENFLPVEVEEALIGKLYEADCYILLKTIIDQSGSLSWQIYFWIGSHSTTDKQSGSAIHAVNLRNMLGAECRTIREEQGDESDEFLACFDSDIVYIEGGRTASGFYTFGEQEWTRRLYRVSGVTKVYLEPVPIACSSLDPRYVYLLDDNKTMYIWMGKKAKLMTRTKTRLIAEKINKQERKNKVTIEMLAQDLEPAIWWEMLGSNPEEIPIHEWVDDNWEPARPRLYQVGLGKGYLELPQVLLSKGKLTKDLLETKNVYILDCLADVYIWTGKKASKLVKAAAYKLAQEIAALIDRPSYTMVSRAIEGVEGPLFKNKFEGWDDVLGVDYTRTAESVSKRGVDVEMDMKTDLSALFMPRQQAMSNEDADLLMAEWNDDLEVMESFVLEGKRFARLPDEEVGLFYNNDCYVFLCKYWVPAEPPEGEEEGDEEIPDDYKCTVYFWQGRKASNMGWLTFTFSLQKKLEARFGDKLEVQRTHQQQENLKFMSHFKRRFVIKNGSRIKNRDTPSADPELFHLRANGSMIATRCVQIGVTAASLNSKFCYILKVPFNADGVSGIVYVWIGEKSDAEDGKLAEEIANWLYDLGQYTIQVVSEGEEPENFFWVGIGGRKPYDHDANYMDYARLFRCSNDKGYFTVSEKCSDFCQDDLSNEDVMILDNGQQVFYWLGTKSSDIELKLGFKSAKVYVEHMNRKQPDRPRKLLLARTGFEQSRFTKCFHGWGRHKVAAQ